MLNILVEISPAKIALILPQITCHKRQMTIIKKIEIHIRQQNMKINILPFQKLMK
jgi:hypothetical protein